MDGPSLHPPQLTVWGGRTSLCSRQAPDGFGADEKSPTPPVYELAALALRASWGDGSTLTRPGQRLTRLMSA
jgi:hypothetical protein